MKDETLKLLRTSIQMLAAAITVGLVISAAPKLFAQANVPSGLAASDVIASAGAGELGCEQLARDPAAGLAGNPFISDVKVVLTPAEFPATAPSGGPANVRHEAYCNVQFTYSGRGDVAAGYAAGQRQHIIIAVGLPLNVRDGGTGREFGAWNGRIQNSGGGGCAGVLRPTTQATDEGYVGSNSDTGHTNEENGQRCDFGVIQADHKLNTGMIDDFIYEGIHQQVEWAKALTRVYYGAPAQRNYWNGCSTGGRQGLALAQKYGDEFDGILAGAPAIYWQEFRLADAWPALMVRDGLTAKGKALSSQQFAAATTAAVNACDVAGRDTVRDGLIADARVCSFSALNNVCGAKGAPEKPLCLDADQADTIDRIWRGPVNDQGKQVWYPFNRGVKQTDGGGLRGGVGASAAQVMSYNHSDLGITTTRLFGSKAAIAAAGNPAGAISYAEEAELGSKEVGDLMGTRAVNLDKLKNRGGKLIVWHGTNDGLIRWTQSLDYYRRVATHYGNGKASFAGLQSWFRYYAAPGVGHCGGDDGPAPADAFKQLVSWVEQGTAPDMLLAKGGSLNPARTRPLCPWPKTAVYKGSGSTDEAANFTCAGDLDASPKALCSMVRTHYKNETGGALDSKDKGISEAQCRKEQTGGP